MEHSSFTNNSRMLWNPTSKHKLCRPFDCFHTTACLCPCLLSAQALTVSVCAQLSAVSACASFCICLQLLWAFSPSPAISHPLVPRMQLFELSSFSPIVCIMVQPLSCQNVTTGCNSGCTGY